MAMPAYAPTNTSKYFLPPQTAGPSPPEEYLYGRSASNTNLNTFGRNPLMPNTPPSTTISPTDNSHHVHVRQLRQPRQPLYIPAALRPTELSAAAIANHPRLPDTPPGSHNNSFDSSKQLGFASAVAFDGTSEDANRLERALHRTTDSLEDSGTQVTGPPTTAHWKPDAAAEACAVCNVKFTWYFRRHHCRRCGGVVCENHSRASVPLDQNARFHSQGFASKACNPCYEEWKFVRKWRHSRASSLAESRISAQESAVPAMLIPQAQRLIEEQQRVGSMARSEGGMVWSTF